MIISLLLSVNIFSQDVTKKYTGEDATMEILLMLFASAILGFLLRHFMGYMSKKEIIIEADKSASSSSAAFMSGDTNSELIALRAENEKLKRDLSSCLDSYNAVKSATSQKINKSVEVKSEKAPVKQKQKTEVNNPVKSKPAAKSTAKTKTTAKKAVSAKKDDLKIIEGIGPALEKLLNSKGIYSFDQLSKEPTKNLEKMLDEAGPRFRVHVPETWAEQAKLLKENKMDAFNALTTKLKGGRRL